jgi:glycosyltransferase involved in cell wall biosynthesis
MVYISVVIPCYNAAPYIERCLDALQQQSFRDFEVILIDDCSKDNTVDVINAYAKRSNLQLALLQNEENAGPGVSRNRGIAASNAEYICFCDSDDWYDPDYLEQMVKASQNGEADMVLCNSRKVTATGKTDIVLFSRKEENATAREVLALGIDSLCNLMIRRPIAVSVPLPGLRNGEDMAVIPLMIMGCKTFGFVEKCIYNYLCRPGSLSLSANSGVTESLKRSFVHITEHQKPGFDREVEFIGMKNLVYGGLLNHFKAQKDPKPAKVLMDQFEKQYPRWYQNPYRKELPVFKRVFLFFAKRRLFLPLRLMCRIHRLLTER